MTLKKYLFSVIRRAGIYGVDISITSLEFGTISDWWDSGVPINIIFDALSAVITRARVKGKQISHYWAFRYDVRRLFQAHSDLHIGGHHQPEAPTAKEKPFHLRLPETLKPLAALFVPPVSQVILGRELLIYFRKDPELNLKAEIFKKNLRPELRTPEVIARYRLNYIKGRYRIPDFDIEGDA